MALYSGGCSRRAIRISILVIAALMCVHHLITPSNLIPEIRADSHKKTTDILSRNNILKFNLLNDIWVDVGEGKFSASKQMKPGYMPNIVHYFWCGIRPLQFRTYMSIVSALRDLRPDRLVLHYDYLPSVDEKYYNLWLDDLKRDYNFFVMQLMTDNQRVMCETSDNAERYRIILKVLNQEGGMYISDTTWLVDLDPEIRKMDMIYAMEEGSMDGFIWMRKGVLNINQTLNEVLSNSSLDVRSMTCSRVRHLHNGQNKTPCLILNEKEYEVDFYPKDIWDLESPFGELSRSIFYGSPEIRTPEPSTDELVPNIGHMVWLRGGQMDMLFFLGALSLLYVQEVETLYIHGDLEPSGQYWEELKTNPRVVHVVHPLYTDVYQDVIGSRYSVVQSDVLRMDVMNRYGGIYMDIDAVWVKPLTLKERAYDIVATYDWVDWAYPYPEQVNLGVFYAKKGAPYFQAFRESTRVLHPTSPGFTGIRMTYKLLEKYPHLLKIDPYLAVICYYQMCHPTWVEGYHNSKVNHISTGSMKNWREDIHAFHFTYPNPAAFANISTLIKSKGMFAEVGQMVLKKAKII